MKRRIKINDDYWTMYLLEREEYESLFGEDSVAITDNNRKTIHFVRSSFDMATITHEITHALISYLCLDSTESITLKDAEEIFASFQGKNILNVLEKSIKVYSSFIKDGKFKNHLKNIKNLKTLWV